MPAITKPHRHAPAFLPALSHRIDQLEANVRRMFETPFGPTPAVYPTPLEAIGWVPPVEISETNGEMLITAELPGLDQKDVHVEVDDYVLTIRGNKWTEREEGEKGKEFYLEERLYGAFERSFTLPTRVDPEKISAGFAKGVLTIHLPKVAETKGREILIAAK